MSGLPYLRQLTAHAEENPCMVADFRGGIGRSLMGDSGVSLIDIGSGWIYISSRAGGTYIVRLFPLGVLGPF